MSFNEWKNVKMGDVISFNPRESIGKQQMAKKVAMENLKPFTKFIDQYELAPFNGGAKFRNGDILLARITPCLENGKTSQVTILDKDEIGFGSTEFIVLRAEAGITDNDYIYYLSISPRLREIAIKSMVGSSGRQRVQQSVLEDIDLCLPPLLEQTAIADTLSCLDDMIELNNHTNKILEEIAQAIFKRWFVDFEFPNENGEPYKSSGGEMVDSELGEIPKGWKAISLGDIGKFIKGKKPIELFYARTNMSQEQYLTIDALNNGIPQFAHRDKMIMADEYDILMVMDGASSGTVYCGMKGIIGSTISTFEVSDSELREIIYQFLKANEWEIKTHNTGSAIPHTDKSYVLRCKVAVPGEKYLGTVSVVFKKIREIIMTNRRHNHNLTAIRDTLLPKLMSGEIRVPIGGVV